MFKLLKPRDKPDAIAEVVDFLTGSVYRARLTRWQEDLYYYTYVDSKGRHRTVICRIDENDKIGIDVETGRPVYVVWGTYVYPDLFVGFSKKIRPEDKFVQLVQKDRVYLGVSSSTATADYLGDMLSGLLEDIYSLERGNPVLYITPHVYFGYSGKKSDLVMASIEDSVKSYADANIAIGQIVKSAGTLDRLKGLLHAQPRNYLAIGIMIFLIVLGIGLALTLILGTTSTKLTTVAKTATAHHATAPRASTSGGVRIVKRSAGRTVAKPTRTIHIARPRVNVSARR